MINSNKRNRVTFEKAFAAEDLNIMLNKRITDFVPFLVYLILATAAIFPFFMGDTFIAVHTAFIIFLIILLSQNRMFSTALFWAFAILSPVFVMYALNGIRSNDPIVFSARIEGAFVACGICAAMAGYYISKFGEAEFCQKFIKAAGLILILTIIYKLKYGFFDRWGTRYFLNGPIVFGWLMGCSAITSLYLYLHYKKTKSFLYASFVFVLGMLWTLSKGPLIAFLFVTFILLISRIQNKRTYYTFLLTIILSVIALQFIPEGALDRIVTIIRVITATSDANDFGSIGIREIMWQNAYQKFQNNLLWGIGVGNWQLYSSSGFFYYPHNLFLEIAAETGLVGLITIIGFIIYLFVKSSEWCRLMLIFFLICESFSGDFNYFRFASIFPLASIVASKLANRHY